MKITEKDCKNKHEILTEIFVKKKKTTNKIWKKEILE